MSKSPELAQLIETFSNGKTRLFMETLVINVKKLAWSDSSKNSFPHVFRILVNILPDDLAPGELTKAHLWQMYRDEKKSTRRCGCISTRIIELVAMTSKETGYAFSEDLLWLVERIELIESRNIRCAAIIRSVICSDIPCRQYVLVTRANNRFLVDKSGFSDHLAAIATDIKSPDLVEDIEKSLSGFAFQSSDNQSSARAFGEFWSHCGAPKPMSEADLNVVVFENLMRHFEDDRDAARIIVRIFLSVAAMRPKGRPLFNIESGIVEDYILSGMFFPLYKRGFRAVVYCLEDPVPEWDMWFLLPGSYSHRSAATKPNIGIPIDVRLSSIPQLQNTFKKWVWDNDISPDALRDKVARTKRLLEDVANGAPVLHKKGRSILIITEKALCDALRERRGTISPEYLGRARKNLSSFLHYAESEGDVSVDLACYIYLDQRAPAPPPPHYIEPVGREHAEKLRLRLEENAEKSKSDALYYVIFRLTQITSLRISQVLDLKVDSVVEIGRKGLYKIETLSKNYGAAKQNVQISHEAKLLIDRAIAITEPLRSQASHKMKSHVFLVCARKGHVRCMRNASYNKYLERVCQEINIAIISTENVRKRRFTDVALIASELKLSPEEIKAIDPHASRSTTDRYYNRPTIREYLTAVNGIEFGGIKAAGTIADDSKAGSDADIVEKGCGWCSSDYCKVQGLVSCLLCKGFWTTPAHIPEFKQLIDDVDCEIAACKNEHDKNHKVAVKKLLLEYLALLYEKKGAQQ